MSYWDDLVEPARVAFEALLRKCDDMVDRIEELEAEGLANRMAIMKLEAKLAKTLAQMQAARLLMFEGLIDDAFDMLDAAIAELKGDNP